MEIQSLKNEKNNILWLKVFYWGGIHLSKQSKSYNSNYLWSLQLFFGSCFPFQGNSCHTLETDTQHLASNLKEKKKINEKMHTFIQYKFIYSLLIIHWSCINLQQIWKWTSTSDVVLSGFCRWDSYFSGVCWRNTTGIVDNEDLGLPSIKPRCPAQEDWLPGVRYHRQIIRSFRPIWECNATKVEA